ncbi:MAG: helix-hairpin-helix domain-containing protein, partial [Gemmataceae bacterium]
MTKDTVAAALDEIATLLALQGENDFRCKAYSMAARTISLLDADLAGLVTEGKLHTVRGIGEALQEKIVTLVTTGRLPYLDDLRAATPAGLLDILRIPGLGPKKVKALHDELQIISMAQLKTACEEKRVAKLKGFGEKTEQKILDGIAFLAVAGQRVRIDQAMPLALKMFEQMRQWPGVVRVELCGSLRRRRETVKDIDIVASASEGAAEAIMARFIALPEARQVVNHGSTKSSIVAEWTPPGQTSPI